MPGYLEPKLELNSVRGLACVALVAYHVIGPTKDSGLHLPDHSHWHVIMNSLDFLRMPMFTVLSGYLYARHRVEREALAEFARKKASRLVAPLLFVTTVMFVLRAAVYGDQTSYLEALFFHYQHLWFLQSLIIIFAGIALWDAFHRPSWPELCIAAFAAVMLTRTFEITPFLSLNGVLYLIPFFALGMIFRTQPVILGSRDLMLLASGVALIVLTMQQLSDAFGGAALTRNSVPAAVCGIAGAYLLLSRFPKVRLLEMIGSFSFSIYLWHSIAASAVRQTIIADMALTTAVEFGILLAVGIAAPIAVHLIVERVPLLSIFAAGIRQPKPLRSAFARPRFGARPYRSTERLSKLRRLAQAGALSREVTASLLRVRRHAKGQESLSPPQDAGS